MPNLFVTPTVSRGSIPMWGTFREQTFVVVVALMAALIAPANESVVPGLVGQDLRLVVETSVALIVAWQNIHLQSARVTIRICGCSSRPHCAAPSSRSGRYAGHIRP